MNSLQFLVLHTASVRSSGNIIPTPDLPRGAQKSVLFQLYRLGYITRGDNPRITGAGLAAVRGHQ
jgi:hypothetical protein